MSYGTDEFHIRPETPSCQFSCIAVPLAVQTSRVEDARSTPATPGHYTLTIHLKGQVGKHSRPNHLRTFATLATHNRWRFHRAQRDNNRIRTNCTRRLLEARCHYFPIPVHSRTPERVSTRRHWAHRAEGGANRSLLSNSSNIHASCGTVRYVDQLAGSFSIGQASRENKSDAAKLPHAWAWECAVRLLRWFATMEVASALH